MKKFPFCCKDTSRGKEEAKVLLGKERERERDRQGGKETEKETEREREKER